MAALRGEEAMQLIEREEMDEDDDLFEVIEKLIAQAINAGDVKKLQDAGIHTCNCLMMHTKKNLTGIKGLSEAKVDKDILFFFMRCGTIGAQSTLSGIKTFSKSSSEQKKHIEDLITAIELNSRGDGTHSVGQMQHWFRELESCYFIAVHKNIKAWCLIVVEEDGISYSKSTFYEISEAGIEKLIETRIKENHFLDTLIGSYVYSPSLVPVPE